jgi:hypothetical protein
VASRRRLWFRVYVLSVALTGLSCSPLHHAPRHPGQTPLRIIDVHTHTRFSGEIVQATGVPNTRERYFQELRDAGVVGAVSHSSRDGAGDVDLRSHHVLHCAGLDDRVDARGLEADLKSGKFGCIKIYLGYVHQFASHPSYEPAYRLAERYDVPVVFHTGDTYSPRAKLKYADPLTIDEVAVDHPRVKFVIAHCGNPWIQSAAEVAYKNPNVYLECSALLTGDMSQRRPQDVEEYVVRPIGWIFGYLEDPTKLMFGTDWPLVAVGPYVEAYKRAIPEKHWDDVFYENALRVFRIPGLEGRTRSER